MQELPPLPPGLEVPIPDTPKPSCIEYRPEIRNTIIMLIFFGLGLYYYHETEGFNGVGFWIFILATFISVCNIVINCCVRFAC